VSPTDQREEGSKLKNDRLFPPEGFCNSEILGQVGLKEGKERGGRIRTLRGKKKCKLRKKKVPLEGSPSRRITWTHRGRENFRRTKGTGEKGHFSKVLRPDDGRGRSLGKRGRGTFLQKQSTRTCGSGPTPPDNPKAKKKKMSRRHPKGHQPTPPKKHFVSCWKRENRAKKGQ